MSASGSCHLLLVLESHGAFTKTSNCQKKYTESTYFYSKADHPATPDVIFCLMASMVWVIFMTTLKLVSMVFLSQIVPQSL